MSQKRWEVVSSPSFSDTSELNQNQNMASNAKPPVSTTGNPLKQLRKKLKQSMETNTNVFASTPKPYSVDMGKENGYKRGTYFLSNCHYCKKRIEENIVIYMYGSLQAFCTVECRDAQIAIDENAKTEFQDKEDEPGVMMLQIGVQHGKPMPPYTSNRP